jgi:tRNA (guanine37-N1)-methyltransferase
MLIELLTLFPEFFASPLSQSMLNRAQGQGAVEFRILNLRDFTTDRHRVTDDRPFGGGPGMVLKIEPLVRAIRAVKQEDPEVRVILFSPRGPLFSQEKAGELAGRQHLLLICGHYEGVDDRLRFYIDEELSIGDYILTGGEIPALVVVDAVTRLLPGVLGGEGAVEVPEILLSGDHQRLNRWRRQEALRRTARQRPDLLEKAVLDDPDREFLATLSDSGKKD